MLCAAGLLALLPLAVRADGEIGVVIQEGGTTETFCVPFKGDFVNGETALGATGKGFTTFGTSSRVVCSIGATGCEAGGSFDDCFCQCKGGGANCTYWGFFTQRYGASWVYSALGPSVVRARDGDLHGWKWGSGSLQSAPVPPPITFEQVCGHSPRGGQAPTATPVPPTATPVRANPTNTSALASSPATSASATPTAGATAPAATRSSAPSTTPTATAQAPGGHSVTTVVILRDDPSPTLAPPATGDADEGGSRTGIVAFTVIAAALAGLAGFIAWRRRAG